MNLETSFKIVAIFLVTGAWLFSVRWLWTSHLDPAATASRLVNRVLTRFEAPDWLATREANKIYQDGQIVGDVTGAVQDVEGGVRFAQLANTNNLDRSAPFDYQRQTLRIVSVGATIGMKSQMVIGDAGAQSTILTALLEDVLCERLR